MLIYNYHYKKDKSEEIILKESIDDYNETFKKIIIKLESKLSLFDINNINLIIKESLKPDFNLNYEIDFIKNEFSSLNKNEYIEKNLEYDFKKFIEEYQFIELIQGIIELINYKNDKYDKNKKSYLFNNLRGIFNDIISKNLNEENVKKFFKSFTSNENYIKNENILIQFYKILFEKKESLSFLTNIENSIKNKNMHSFFTQNEIDNLLDLYNFFRQLLNNKEIKSEKDFVEMYNKEKEKNNNIKNYLEQLNNKFITYSKKQIESNKIRNLITENSIKNFFKIYFGYEGVQILILGSSNDSMKNIINKFFEKTHAKRNSIHFLYNGNIINEDSLLEQIANKEDKLRKEMKILVYSYNRVNQNNSIIKSEEVICPKCFGNINLKVENYKISLLNCKNNHSIKDLLFKDFLDTQNIDLKKIICNICKNNNKYNTFKNEFYICLDCHKNLCALCKDKHDKSHRIINYDKRNTCCEIHLEESYNYYCKSCNQNLCVRCKKDHENHEIKDYGDILPSKEETKRRIIDLENSIKQLNANIDYIINRFASFKENMNNFLQIYKNIMQNVEKQNRSYEMLNNMYKINNNDVMEDIKHIVRENNLKNKINMIYDIIDKEENFDNNELTLIYKINKDDKEIKIFDSVFVKNNRNICKIKYENKEYELTEYFKVDSKNEKLEIRLKGFKNIINANKMFYGCKALISMPDIIKLNLLNLREKSEMFYEYDQSLNIPEFLKQ